MWVLIRATIRNAMQRMASAENKKMQRINYEEGETITSFMKINIRKADKQRR